MTTAGDYSYLSSPSPGGTTAAEVEALIDEAADLVTLEQIARLNSAHIADDALLPADVESRFRRLKTFPPPSGTPTKDTPSRHSDKGFAQPPAAEQPPEEEHEESKLSKSGPPLDKDASFKPVAADTVSPVMPDGEDKRSRGRGPHPSSPISPISPSASSSSSPSTRGGSPSPPRGRACCFGFSPRSGDRLKKGVRNRRGDVGSRTCDSYGPLLPDLGAFSPREQRRSMRKAMEEEEKVLREAQRMVKWMKQASARMEVSAATVDELLSELEDEASGR